ncbi:ABC transporter substrate-binding protein [Leucobacter chromiireducens subsp. chromiireducens]|uniref:ABC transporter substrate-binding protein n=2 Tax=Leucobacter TaxID=55968 RepID=A0ABS1SNG5_9MICO|nr:ABC transporter substrate-binding protein [Leucobacter chromiireducens]MBL3689698.1 ABC transporter substrate-binding protein [Leucobacter chromiireducens subsp. chromiireducens]
MGLSFIALAAAGALALSGCTSGGGSDNGGDAAASDAIITTNGSEPQNPLIATNTNEVGGGKILDQIFAGLVYYDADGAAHNDIATSIETDDAINYTIKIRDDATFTDGTPVKAENFVKAWNYGADSENAQLNSYFFEDVEGFSYEDSVKELPGLKVVDDTTFTVKLNKAASDFPQRLGYSAFYPLPDAAFEDMDAQGENPIVNGPYKLAGEGAWQHDEQIELVVNEDYNGPRKPVNGGLTIKFYATQDASYSDLMGGNLDVVDQIPETQLANFQDDLGDRAVNQPAAIFQSFTIPERLEHFSGEEGKLRRQAISMAINREQITDKIFDGTRTPASDFTSPVIDGWSDSLKGAEVLAFNPDEAKKLWAEADKLSPWSGTLEIAYNSDGGHQAWVDAVSNSVSSTLGITAAGKAYPKFDVLREEVTNRTIKTAFRTGWQADYPGLFNFLGPLYATNASSNDGDYSNPEFDKLLQEGSVETDPAKANEKFQQAQEVLLADLPAFPLWYANVNGGYGENVDNVEFGWNSVPLYHEITKK